MFGQNPIRGLEKGDGSQLQVVEIFPTLQGEGPFVGQPSVFVRLGGCNLACNFCDTEFEKFSAMPMAGVVADVIRKARGLYDLVVITGGEPLRQNIGPFCEALLGEGFRIQIETNGTLWRPLPASVDIVCSPKMTNGAYHPLHPDLLARVSALKFIIAADRGDYHDIGQVGQVPGTPIYVQPMDEGDPAKNIANQKRALKLALENGYRLSLQTHKMLGIA